MYLPLFLIIIRAYIKAYASYQCKKNALGILRQTAYQQFTSKKNPGRRLKALRVI